MNVNYTMNLNIFLCSNCIPPRKFGTKGIIFRFGPYITIKKTNNSTKCKIRRRYSELTKQELNRRFFRTKFLLDKKLYKNNDKCSKKVKRRSQQEQLINEYVILSNCHKVF
jgi:hypothetical protein